MQNFKEIKKDRKLPDLDFSKLNGLVPAVAQDYANGEVLMVAFMNREAWEKTLETGMDGIGREKGKSSG